MPDLGKYALEVNSVYALSVVLLLALVGLTWRRSVKVRHALEEAEKRLSDG